MDRVRILVVDDEPNVLVTYRLILQQKGYDVTAAISAEKARHEIEQNSFGLILCDLSLEKQESGFDVIEFARAKTPGQPSILLTGYATQDANEWADQRGVPILFKPIDIKQLLQTIEDLLRKGNDTSEAPRG